MDIICLTQKFKYKFKNIDLLYQALTHCSFGNCNNERLEFFGDSILNFIISNEIYTRFPEYDEGELSRIRSFLVNKDTLLGIAYKINLDKYIVIGKGEKYIQSSIMSNTLEAVFAAIYLDGGFEIVQKIILDLYKFYLENMNVYNLCKDSKTELQELLQAYKKVLPNYSIIKISEKKNKKIFHVLCSIYDMNLFETGIGITKRKAEQHAAYRILKKLKK